MNIEQKKMRIGEITQTLNIDRTIINLWEKEFNLKIEQSASGQRLYTHQDLQKLMLLKELIYTKKYSIAVTKRYLTKLSSPQEQSIDNSLEETITPSTRASSNTTGQALQNAKNTQIELKDTSNLSEKLITLQQKLLQLRELL
ncbi:MerR family transcriptional regulator [Candidatus Dependentiae bacterium]|nr:MerR family transcriptional regulator [Candidatus Dependentiae bacterium]